MNRPLPKIEKLTDKEHEWVGLQLQGAAKLIDIYAPDAGSNPLTLAALDQAYDAWVAGNESNADIINTVINRVGIALGQFLVDDLGLEWVIATEDDGKDRKQISCNRLMRNLPRR